MQPHLDFTFLIFLLAAAAAAATPTSERQQVLLGGYNPIKNLSEPHVMEVAQFAVKEHNKQDKANTARLLKIIKGWTQVVAGINYRLIITVRPLPHRRGGRRYEAVVYERSWQHVMNLTSFMPLI